MADHKSNRDPVEAMATEFVERRRLGESPSIDEYVQKHPDSADAIRDLLPVVGALERLRDQREQLSGGLLARSMPKLERLGDFRIIRELGRGSMGIVFEAEQESLDRRVAIKVMPNLSILGEKRLGRFRREAQIAARLHHTHIVPIFGIGQQDDYYYHVMQLIVGVGLDEIIAELQRIVAPGRASDETDPAGIIGGSVGNTTSLAKSLISGHPYRDQSARDVTEAEGASQRPDSLDGHGAEGARTAQPENEVEAASNSDSGSGASGAVSKTPKATRPTAAVGTLGPQYWRSVARIGLQATEALAYAHSEQTLHRDIKPSNLLLDTDGRVWIADFGLAKALESHDVTHSNDVVGTLRYMAPEQFSGRANQQSDIYSLGLTLYELLTLQPAYQAVSRATLVRNIMDTAPARPQQTNPNIPRDLETIVLKAIAHDPRQRYQTAGAMAKDLRLHLEDRPIRAHRAGMAERLWRWCRRNPAVASLTTTTFVSVIVVAIVSTTAYLRTKKANLQVREALLETTRQRQRATDVSGVALDSLEKIFSQLAPERMEPSKLTITDVKGARKISFVFSDQTAALLEQMLAFYDRLGKRTGNDAVLLARKAEAQARLGYICYTINQFEKAEAAYLQAADIYESLTDRLPERDDFLLASAKVQNELGDSCWAMSQSGKAIACYHRALGILESAPQLHQSPKRRFAIASCCYRLRRRPAITRLPSWLVLRFLPTNQSIRWCGDENRLAQAVDLLESLLKEEPHNPRYRYMLALCYREQRCEQGLFGQMPSITQAAGILEELYQQHPKVPDYRYDLGLTYANVNVFGPQFSDDLASLAEKRLRRAEELLDAVTRENPNVVKYVEALASVHHQLGELLWREGRPGRRTRLTWAQGLVLPLEQRYPEVPAYQVWRAIVQISMGGIDRENGDWKVARTTLQPAVGALEDLSKKAAYDLPVDVHSLLAQAREDLAATIRRLQPGPAGAAAVSHEKR